MFLFCIVFKKDKYSKTLMPGEKKKKLYNFYKTDYAAS